MDNIISVFQTETTTSGVWLLMFLASFVGGILASISPCSLAMLPLIIGYVGGYSKETPARTLIQLCCFILGTAIIFTLIGIICAITGNVFASAFGPYFTLLIASLLLVIGLKLLNILDFDLPIIIKAMPQNTTSSLVVYPILLGMTFALAGTPCSTPILAGIMAFAAIGKNLFAAIIMLFLFALGQGVILIITGLFTSGIKNLKKLSDFTGKIMQMSGVLFILVAIYMYYKIFVPLF